MELNEEIKKLAIDSNNAITTANMENLGFSRALISLYEKTDFWKGEHTEFTSCQTA